MEQTSRSLIAENLKKLRAALELTHVGMGRMAGVTGRAWQDYEAGIKTPRGRVFEALAKEGINTNWLFTGQGEMRAAATAGVAQGAPLDGSLLAACIHQIDRALGFSSYLSDSVHMRRGPLLSSRDMGHFAAEFYQRARAIALISEQDELVRSCAEHLHLLVYGRQPLRHIEPDQVARLSVFDFPDMQDAAATPLTRHARVFQLLEELTLVKWDGEATGRLHQLLISRQGLPPPEAPRDDFAAFRWETIRSQRLGLVRSGMVAFTPGQDFARSMDVDRCTAHLLEIARLETSIIVDGHIQPIEDFAVERGDAIAEWLQATFPSPISMEALVTIAKVCFRGLKSFDKYSGTSYATDLGIEAFLSRFAVAGDTPAGEQAADELQRLLSAIFRAIRRDLQ